MPIIQDAIHKLEVAGGRRYFRVGLLVLAVIGLTVFYNYKCFRNMATQEAMDSAQLARNIATGKGYTTYYIRPFSMFLLRRHSEPKAPPGTRLSDLTRIRERHPDTANAPVYPLVLAALMKVLPFHFALPDKPTPFWSQNGMFARHQPDFVISVFNQLLFFGLVVAIFFLARRLFDTPTAWLSAALVFGADVLWRFSMSGLSTMLLLLIFVGIVWCLLLLEEAGREFNRSIVITLLLAAAVGGLLGIGGLTRYSFAWLVIPAVAYLYIFGGPQRLILASLALVLFLVLMLPWVIRNLHLTGTPFGVAGYFAYDGTGLFPENRLDRALQPELPTFNKLWITVLIHKLLLNTRHIFQNDLVRLGGGFISVFFLVSLVIPLGNVAASRLRYFLLGSLILLMITQALGRTHLTEDSPDINMENLLVLLAPLVIVFGVQFFWLVLNQIALPFRELRYVVIGLFCLLTCLPMLFSLLPPKTSPIAYPPYFPPYIQRAAAFINQDELSMCDIPWAMAWYGNVPSVQLTEGSDEFIDIDSLQKPIKELYLTHATLNGHFLSQWVPSTDGWGYVLLRGWEAVVHDYGLGWPREVNFTLNRVNAAPVPLALHYFQAGWPQECLLTARNRPVTIESK